MQNTSAISRMPSRRHRDHSGVGDGRDLDLGLPDADGLHDDDVEAGRIEHEQRLRRRPGEAAQVTAARHRADEDPVVHHVVLHPDAIAQQGAARERRRGIHGQHRDRPPGAAPGGDELVGQRRLADPRRAGDADHLGLPRVGVEATDDLAQALVGAVLDARERPGEGATLTSQQPLDELRGLHRPEATQRPAVSPTSASHPGRYRFAT
jgi:hypothetical protein